MGKKNVHITPHKDGGWQAKKEGAERASAVTATKQQAVDAGRALAKKAEAELVIHGRDGRIQDKDSYGADPNPPKDNIH